MELQARNEQRAIGIDLSAEVDNYAAPPPTDDVPLLRDDRAPVDSLLDAMVGQRYVVRESAANGSVSNATATSPGRGRMPMA